MSQEDSMTESKPCPPLPITLLTEHLSQRIQDGGTLHIQFSTTV